MTAYLLMEKYRDEDTEVHGVFANTESLEEWFRENVLSKPFAEGVEYSPGDILKGSVEIARGVYWVKAYNVRC